MSGQIVLVNPRYLRDNIYLNNSISAVAAMLMHAGRAVKVIDLNMDRLEDRLTRSILSDAEAIGISLPGPCFFPVVIELLGWIGIIAPGVPILLGGAVIEKLKPEQFTKIFGASGRIVQIRSSADLARTLGIRFRSLPDPLALPFHPVWKNMGDVRMAAYIGHEMALIISQGCHFRCDFCAALKGRRETFRGEACFESDLRYLVDLAERSGVVTLNFYASNLDFFQNPKSVIRYLDILAQVRSQARVDIRLRCLACLSSFLKACETFPDLESRLRKAGLWCIGFGVDGSEEAVWRAEHKAHNTISHFVAAFDRCAEMGIRPELLMVVGFPEDTLKTLAKSVALSLRALVRWPDVMLRPYLAKPFIPGNNLWEDEVPGVGEACERPGLFYNLDYTALGSRLTHPRRSHRWASNLAYLSLFACQAAGKSSTTPLLPQGERGVYGWLARIINPHLPLDR